MALLNEINVKGVPHPIVTDDGYYEEMTVGDAEQLIATQFVEDGEPYLFRPTGGSSDVGNRAYLDKIVGGTVAWNQLVRAMRGSGSEKGLTFTRNADDSLNISGTITEAFNYNYVPFTFTELNFKRDGRKYLLMLNKPTPYAWGVSGYSPTETSVNSIGVMWSNNAGTDWVNGLIFRAEVGTTIDIQDLRAMVFDLTQMFGSTIADYIYSIEQSQAGAGVAWFKKLFPKDYYAYNAGELLSVEGLKSHDTVGFNQWDEETRLGTYSASDGSYASNYTDRLCTKNAIKVCPSTTYYLKTKAGLEAGNMYFYDANMGFISSLTNEGNSTFTTPANCEYINASFGLAYGTTYNHDICINLSDPSRNDEYEPYEKHSYPLDSSLTLRGIPKLDASNNLYYDGDEHKADGSVTRKYGIVDLGTLDWVRNASNRFYADIDISGKASGSYDENTNIICSRYESKTLNQIFAQTEGISIHSLNGNSIWIYDTRFTEGADVKEGLNGVVCYYELATPTTEEAEPFQRIQIVDDFGTEEFVGTGIIPAGHNTHYPANLRDKLQHLPELAGMDGTYLIQQSGKQMSLIHMPAVFPEVPTEDGTYTLKATVNGGTPTYVWKDVNAESGGE